MEPLTAGLIGAGIGSGLSGIFGGSDSSDPIPAMRPEQWQAIGKIMPPSLQKALERIELTGQPYGGTLTAGLSDIEKTGLGSLEDFLSSTPSTETPLFGLAQGELEKTLAGGEYDPIGGTYYQAFRKAVMRELRDAKDRLAAETSAADKFFGGGRIKTAGRLEESAMGDLAQVLGQLFENERTRRLSAVGPALQLATYGELAPLQRIEAALSLGARPREIEQAELTAQYQEWLRQLEDLGIPLSVVTGMALQSPDFYTEEPSDLSGSYGNLGAALAMLAASGGGGGGSPVGDYNPMAVWGAPSDYLYR